MSEKDPWKQLVKRKPRKRRSITQPTLLQEDVSTTEDNSIQPTVETKNNPTNTTTTTSILPPRKPFHFTSRTKPNNTCTHLAYEANPSAIPSGPQDQRATIAVEEEQPPETNKKKRGIFGPKKAPSHIRMSVRFDYQPDICKDYKETGYCGFGDACKFLHDRSDYKSSWQLEQEWEQQQQKQQQPKVQPTTPFACFICRKSFVSPVVTLCGHYFCEQCALEYHRSHGGKCAVCGKATKGVFNSATNIQ